ncbi:hypothetical protein Tco_1129633, partial [Tanacetum coccineum]
VVWRLKSLSRKRLEFDALLGNFGGNGAKLNGGYPLSRNLNY